MLVDMTLNEYLADRKAVDLARLIGAPPVLLSQWRSGVRPVPIERCTAIEVATERAVRRWDLRPDDWWKIWPELAGLDGAPAVPSPEPAERATT